MDDPVEPLEVKLPTDGENGNFTYGLQPITGELVEFDRTWQHPVAEGKKVELRIAAELEPDVHHPVKIFGRPNRLVYCPHAQGVYDAKEDARNGIRLLRFHYIGNTKEIKELLSADHIRASRGVLHVQTGLYSVSVDVFTMPGISQHRHRLFRIAGKPWIAVACPHKRALFLYKMEDESDSDSESASDSE
ncbi:MAG: hypothetical protein JSS82_00285 [Bacteroidetes bacterium]|nr:hypothetical protein [Bacteroidota bacterium]